MREKGGHTVRSANITMMWRRVVPYGCGLGVTVVGVAIVAALGIPTSALLVPVIIVAYRGKLGPGLLALAVAVTGAVILGGPARGFVLALDGALLSFVIEALHRSRRRERNARIAERGSQRRFQQLFDASPVALSVSELDDRRVLEVNDAYLRLFGVRRSEILGHTPADAGIVSGAGSREKMFEALRSHGSVEAAFDVTTRSGVHNLLLWSRVIDLDGQRCALSTFIDVTSERKAHTAAYESDERLRELAETVREVFWVTDPHNREMLYVSPAYETIFGRRCADLYKDPRDWLVAIHPTTVNGCASGRSVPPRSHRRSSTGSRAPTGRSAR